MAGVPIARSHRAAFGWPVASVAAQPVGLDPIRELCERHGAIDLQAAVGIAQAVERHREIATQYVTGAQT
jgi:hypothetical protein